MNDEQRETFRVALTEAFCGNQQAVQLCLDTLDVLHLWDDLIDKDKTRTDSDINAAFRCLIYDIPMNPVYRQLQGTIAPLMLNIMLKWRDANILESEGADVDLHKAYMLRAGVYDLFAYLAYAIGGDEWSEKVGPKLRRLYGEQLNDYLKEMHHA